MIIQVVDIVKTRLKFQLNRLLLATNMQCIEENGHEVWRLDYLVKQRSARALSSKRKKKRRIKIQFAACSIRRAKHHYLS